MVNRGQNVLPDSVSELKEMLISITKKGQQLEAESNEIASQNKDLTNQKDDLVSRPISFTNIYGNLS